MKRLSQLLRVPRMEDHPSRLAQHETVFSVPDRLYNKVAYIYDVIRRHQRLQLGTKIVSASLGHSDPMTGKYTFIAIINELRLRNIKLEVVF